MYHILTNKLANEEEDAILEGRSAYLARIECSFCDGLPLPSDDIDTPIVFKLYEYTLRGTMTDHLNINSIPGPVFSLNTKTLLEKKGITNIEYYQLTLVDEFPQGKKTDQNDTDNPKLIEYTNYFIANVVVLVDCVDHEKSILEYFYPPELRDQKKEDPNKEDDINDPFAGENPNDIDFITKLVLDENKIDPKLKVFRLKDQPNLLVFHESIVNLIRKEKLSGFVFVPVAEYTDAIQDDDEKEEANKELKEKKVVSQPKQKDEPKEQKQEKEDLKKTRKADLAFN